MNTLAIKSTYYPPERLSINRWFRYIMNKDLNLEEIDTDTIIGSSIVEGYKNNPELAVKELKQMAADNRDMVIKVIGLNNFNKIK